MIRSSIKNTPTPIQKVQMPDIGDLFIKFEGGIDEYWSWSKLRMLSYTLEYIKDNWYSWIVMDGYPRSNSCMCYSIYCKKKWIDPYIMIKDLKKKKESYNYKQIEQYAKELRYCDSSDDIQSLKLSRSHELAKQEEKLLILPTWWCDTFNIEGFIDLGKEIALQEKDMWLLFQNIVLPVGEWWTIIWLEVAKKQLHRNRNIIWVSIDNYDYKYYTNRSNYLMWKSIDLNIQFLKHEGYGEYSKQDIKDIKHITTDTGLYFDPIYTYKCLKWIKHLSSLQAGNTLMLHTWGWNYKL